VNSWNSWYSAAASLFAVVAEISDLQLVVAGHRHDVEQKLNPVPENCKASYTRSLRAHILVA
jgi:hypothetical protein